MKSTFYSCPEEILLWFGLLISVPDLSICAEGGVVNYSFVGALPCVGITMRLFRVYIREVFFDRDSREAWLWTYWFVDASALKLIN